MEALEEVVGTGSKDHTHIVKGKRTKRQRPQSPIPFAIATHSSSGDGDGGYTNAATATATNNINTTSSPATSAELVESATEEEEDMANCLILLAQGHSRDLSLKQNNQDHEHIGFKFKSKRFLAAASTGNGKAGMYVYQCKTCSRTFPSFQALGGHRASHKKPKLAAMAVEKRPVTLFSDEEKQPKNHISSSSLSLQLSNRPWYGNPKSSTKIHECAICGAEFMSGQALGGHMRRHRTATGGANTTLSLSPLSPIGCDSSEDQEAKKPRIVLSLDLDLNLPAPEESNFTFASKQQHEQQQQQQQQSPLVLPAVPTLVDCHY